jgi:hypothetical protein
MPTIQGTDLFPGPFSVPPYEAVDGSPESDTADRFGNDPASLKCSVVAGFEGVQRAITGTPVRPWHGFRFKLNAADEPAGDVQMAKVGATDANNGLLVYQPGSNRFYHTISGGAEFPVLAYTLDTWVWVEMILDCSGATRTLYTRIDGTDLTPTNRVVAASTGINGGVGVQDSATTTMRYSYHAWGSAASNTDWSGPLASVASLLLETQKLRSRGGSW